MQCNEEYAYETFKPLDPILSEVLQRANQHQMPNIHVGAMAGQHLEVLIRMAGYKKAVEIGTLAGFSGICIARGIGPDGILHTVDIDPAYAEVARESFEKAGASKNVKIHVGVALEVLETLESEGPFDVVFIDADKDNYPNYLKWAEKNLRVGGAVIGDNTFGWGRMKSNPADTNPRIVKSVEGIRQFNDYLVNSPRWRATILPTQQGLTVGVKIA